jgi:F-box domain
MRNQEEQQVRGTHLTEIPIDDAQPSNSKIINSTSNRLSNQNESVFYINNASNQSLFDSLSSELLCQILGYCTLSELYILKQVCNLWKQTIEDFPTIGVLRTYEINLKRSILWGYLPAIINNEPLFA